jgi:hypothetical protein
MIDLRSMSGWPSIQNSRRARAQGGALLGELDRETHAFGLATTGGMVHHTGVGGSRWAGGIPCAWWQPPHPGCAGSANSGHRRPAPLSMTLPGNVPVNSSGPAGGLADAAGKVRTPGVV